IEGATPNPTMQNARNLYKEAKKLCKGQGIPWGRISFATRNQIFEFLFRDIAAEDAKNVMSVGYWPSKEFEKRFGIKKVHGKNGIEVRLITNRN
ncbi:MAG: hypothetical protein NUV67_01405, partial [archaeon]|nr:hypothetical protein [archaeon]